ncbi:MAG: hypothetical protein J0I32_23255 [Sphingobacteriales bacterium]|nr:hypothetical protein [Sphingobacteriales bacterium]OJW01959.1 MAG: hypothetical protein BGO52_00305 [Sphingobacteriales bacterium 44-61]
MKHILISLILLSNLSSTWGQDSIAHYIDQLNCESIFLKINYGTELRLTRDAEAIVACLDHKITRKLVKELSNEHKTAVIHAILTKKFEPEKYSYKAESIQQGDSVVAIIYQCNGLSWRYDLQQKTCAPKPEDINRIKQYWETQLPVYLRMDKSKRKHRSTKT